MVHLDERPVPAIYSAFRDAASERPKSRCTTSAIAGYRLADSLYVIPRALTPKHTLSLAGLSILLTLGLATIRPVNAWVVRRPDWSRFRQASVTGENSRLHQCPLGCSLPQEAQPGGGSVHRHSAVLMRQLAFEDTA